MKRTIRPAAKVYFVEYKYNNYNDHFPVGIFSTLEKVAEATKGHEGDYDVSCWTVDTRESRDIYFRNGEWS